MPIILVSWSQVHPGDPARYHWSCKPSPHCALSKLTMWLRKLNLCLNIMILVISEGSHGQSPCPSNLHMGTLISTSYLALSSQHSLITAKWMLVHALIPRLSYYLEIFVLIIVIMGSLCQKTGTNLTILGRKIENWARMKTIEIPWFKFIQKLFFWRSTERGIKRGPFGIPVPE